MDDLISRQAAIDAAIVAADEWDGGYSRSRDEIIAMKLQALPPAQPEIIYCKECRWRKDQSGSIAWLPCRAIVTPSDFYCSRAERRTDE